MRESVKLLRTTVTLMVLAAWLPATSHCLLSGAGLMPGSCETDHHHGDAPAHSHDNCGQCALESGGFKLNDPDALQLAFTPVLTWQLRLHLPPPEMTVLILSDSGRAPPDQSRWQFQTRAALPGRAPAIL